MDSRGAIIQWSFEIVVTKRERKMADKAANTSERVMEAKSKGKVVEENSNEGEVGAGTRPGFKAKNVSLTPPKKKLVKTMMADYIGEAIASSINKDKNKNKQKINPADAESA
ncbi:hypothetical protein F0562_002801 [Nyssa sinensis]|uniref:Uncharacterized protein n=1 Tax=Nyssa sinensis TaxID=561372 RepID=A0A5J5BWJ3_9ASTE|nr:hypothetical protein F0562_002801 [Nyssa sinensis]